MRKITKVLVSIGLIFASLCIIDALVLLEKPAVPEIVKLPKLHVEGNRIVDENGSVKVLRGVAIADPYCLKEVNNHLLEKDFKVLAQDWKAKIIRIPIHPDLWEHNYLEDYVDPIVDWGRKYSMYIFLGWHAHGNPITGEVEDTPWGKNWPWHGNPYNPSKELAISALKEMVQRYRDKPWVIYGMFNEPAYISWDEWRPVAEELVDAIHLVDPSALVIVPGVDWGYDLSAVLDNPVNRPNVVYETHPYPWKGEKWKDFVRNLSQKYPVFFGEWGYGRNESPGFDSENYGKPLVNFCKELNIGWTAWVWHNEWTPSMLTSLADYGTTDYGEFVKNTLNKN